jgi:ribose transport system permease protein
VINTAAIGKRAGQILITNGLIVAFGVLLVVFSFASDVFFSFENVRLVLRQVSVLGIIACGMTALLVSGNLDLSVGAVVSLSAFLMVDLHEKLGLWPAVVITMLVGLVLGCVNGFFVGFLRLNSIIITLGMMSVVQALTLLYSNGYYITIMNPELQPFSQLGRGFIAGIPVPVVVYAFVIAVFFVLLTKTKFGLFAYAIGGNTKAVRYSGIRERRVVFALFVLVSLCAALGGIIFASRNMAAQTAVGKGLEFEVVAAVVLGVTSVRGGYGSIFKTVIGVLILGFVNNAFILFGLPHFATAIVEWVIIIAAVWVDNVGRTVKESI